MTQRLLSTTTSTATSTATSATPSQDSAYSKTNVQYASVDELDWVKNDGRYMWTLTSQGGDLVLTKASLTPASDMKKLVQSRWPGTVTSGDLTSSLNAEGLFVLSNGQIATVLSGGMNYAMYWGDVTVANARTSIYPGPGAAVQPYTEIRILDTQADSFSVAKTWKVNGRMLAARRMAGSDALVLVTEAPVIWPTSMVWFPDVSKAATQAEREQLWPGALKAALDANLALIAAQPLAAWLGQETAPSAAECAGYARADAENRLALTRIATINPVSQTRQDTVVLTEGSSVYVSDQSLVLSSRVWNASNGSVWQNVFTDLHRFSLDEEARATYRASGRIEGWLINRFAMDEAQMDGRIMLRLAVAARSTLSDTTTQPYSYVASLEQKGSKLLQAAISAPIAPGETLQSARFVGDRAYLVTFRVVDPFFVFDLSDPDKIVALGDLKVPGYSTYLHPISDTLIFGLGLDSGSWPRRIKASLFDVSNPAVPVEVATQQLGDGASWSEALWEPHALTFYPATEADGSTATWIGVPVGAEIKLLKVSQGTGLTAHGAMAAPLPAWSYDANTARRSVFVGDQVYGLFRSFEPVYSSPVASGAPAYPGSVMSSYYIGAAPILNPAGLLGTLSLQ